MMVTDTQVAALRAVLTGDDDTFDHLSMDPDITTGNGFSALTAAAFVAAARRRFPGDWSASDVIRFVGQVRARSDGQQADVNAAAAEHLLLSALRGTPANGTFAEETKGYAQVALLTDLVSDIEHQQLDVFLNYARTQADQWLASEPTPLGNQP